VDLTPWTELQAWLATAEHRVTIPYAMLLADLVEPVAVRLRRDFGAVLSLVRAHAVLHQLSRDRDAAGRLIASIDDYSAVRDLVADVLAEGVGSTVSEQMRQTVEAVARLAPRHKDGVTAAVVAVELDLDKSAARRRLKAAADKDYVKNLEERRGQPGRWVTDEPLPDTVALLPDPEAVAGGQAVVPPDATAGPAETVVPQGDEASGGTVASGSEGAKRPPPEPDESDTDDLGARVSQSDLDEVVLSAETTESEAGCPWCGEAKPLYPPTDDVKVPVPDRLCVGCIAIAREGREEV
jgi:hypothetical protein